MDFAGADILWSLFSSSLDSYRRDTVLRPFPPTFLTTEKEKDFDQLIKVTKSCPCLEEVNKDFINLDYRLANLLRWVLNPKNFTLIHVKSEKFEEIYQLAHDGPDKPRVTKPDYIFEVRYSVGLEKKFQTLRDDRRLLYAFHGSKVENFYSILNLGLKNVLNKVSLYGEGIYLSSDLNLSLTYSPQGKGWEKSIFGKSLSCVALCEMIDHVDVKCTLKYTEHHGKSQPAGAGEIPLDGSVRQSSSSMLNTVDLKSDVSGSSSQTVIRRASCKRSKIAGSEGGEIPDKYFVVRNDDLLRVKYLLVYCPNKPSKMAVAGKNATNFLRRHQFVLLMFLYILLLLIINLYSNSFRIPL